MADAGRIDSQGYDCHILRCCYGIYLGYVMPNYLQTRRVKTILFLLLILVGGPLHVGAVSADACTYGEAIMALEKGNAVRGMALMRMASRDGDSRAEDYLRGQDYREQNYVAELPVFARNRQPLSVASRD